MSVQSMINLRDVRLPEFDKNRRIEQMKALIFDQPCRYDVIIGSDFLDAMKVKIDYETKEVKWFGDAIPLWNPQDFTSDDFNDLAECFVTQLDDETIEEDWMDSYSTQSTRKLT